eukprot:TRINITY_DN316_c0_g1_i1.p2 TRINITY_DN316_c0_g1~~TRINITY_DN316_c0_g1_i1.p2  ORF type:complete len:120 (-),score=24.06 TRINITY_DN316_c0_g1_i1:35-394(-)
MTWVQKQMEDESIFPAVQCPLFFVSSSLKPTCCLRVATPFPKNFQTVVKNIFKRLFRVHAHIYYSHFDTIRALGEEAHLNTSFKHFIFFVTEFDLIPKAELEPLQELVDSFLAGASAST